MVLKSFFAKVLCAIKFLFCRAISRLKELFYAIAGLWFALGPRWIRISILVLVLVVIGYRDVKRVLAPNLTSETVTHVHYLNDGWSEQERDWYYFTPQGTELLGMRYGWLENLELPLSEQMLASEDNMRGWGFIVTPGQFASASNPGNLPLGFARHHDPVSGEEMLDLTCAVCHTGELHYQGVALRVDGGQGMQGISTGARGEFITTMGAAIVETYINPSKWNRFASRIAGKDKTARKKLRRDIRQFIGRLITFSRGAGSSKYYPTIEGRGRTDAVGRIGNVVFGFDIDEPKNYRVANAPVSYPFLWDIWRFDWVQYTGFTNQAIARNVGESLGVMAPIKLVNQDGELLKSNEFGETVVNLQGMHCIEGVLHSLKPPKWPEDILGKIDIDSATRGKNLFADHCAYCHGPHISKPYAWPVADGPTSNPDYQYDVNWKWDMAGEITTIDSVPYRQDWRETLWAMPWIDANVVGTDSTAVDNFLNTKYDASKIIPSASAVNAGDGLQILLNRLIPKLYEFDGITGADIPNYDGLNVPFRIANKRAYKSRPLHGVWATPPFLHNGSVPTIYDLLSPLRARPKQFYVGHREYDPVKLGYVTDQHPGGFLFDTSVTGNGNQGHLFTDVEMPGRIGHMLTEQQRMDLIEYIKVMGNPEFSASLGGDPLNWDNYSPPPAKDKSLASCQKLPPQNFDVQDEAEQLHEENPDIGQILEFKPISRAEAMR